MTDICISDSKSGLTHIIMTILNQYICFLHSFFSKILIDCFSVILLEKTLHLIVIHSD